MCMSRFYQKQLLQVAVVWLSFYISLQHAILSSSRFRVPAQIWLLVGLLTERHHLRPPPYNGRAVTTEALFHPRAFEQTFPLLPALSFFIP